MTNGGGAPSLAETVALNRIQRAEKLTTIPNLIMIFVIVIGGLHIIASLFSVVDITDFGRLRTPAMVLFTGLVLMFVVTLLNTGDVRSLTVALRSWQVVFALSILLAFIWWLSVNSEMILPDIFSLI